MSIWTSESSGPRAIAVAALILLSGCVSDIGGAGVSGPPSRLSVAGGEVIIAGPHGYCIDKRSMRDNVDGAFALLGSCASLARSALAPRPQAPVALSATVSSPRGGTPISQSTAALKQFFGSEAGRKALSRSGRAETTTVLDSFDERGAFYLHVSDGGVDSWRALMDMGERLVTLVVLSETSEGTKPVDGLPTLRAFVSRMQSANRG